MKKRKLLVITLVLAMLVGVLAGCSKKEETPSNNGSTTTNEGNTSGDSSTSKDESGSKNNGEIVTLKWITIGSGMPTNYDSWIKKVNEYAGEKVGVNIKMEVVPWGDWDNRRNVIINTNEAYDMIFGNGNNYTPDINLGAYLDLTDLYKENMPGLCEMMPEAYWEAMKVDGKVYGVPTYKDNALSNYAIWDKELVDTYNIDIASLTEIPSLTPTFEMLKKEKNDYPVYTKNDGIYYIFDAYDQMGAGCQILGVRYDDKNAKVCYTLEEPDVYAALETFHDWYKKGIINPDASTLSEARVYNMWRVAQGWESAGITSWGPQMGKDVVVTKVGDSILSNDTVRGSYNAISANSKYPEKCLQFLDLLNTDTKLRDMFYFGEEGVNFEYNEEGRAHKINEEWTMAGYTQATFFTVTQLDTDLYNQWDEIKALNEGAVSSVLLGFNLDTTEINNEIANCREIWLRYRSEVMTGVLDPAKAVPEIKEKLMGAGWQKIIDTAQAQVDEFMASK